MLDKILSQSKIACQSLQDLDEISINQMLLSISQNLIKFSDDIISANRLDLANENLTSAFRDRLLLDSDRIAKISASLKELINLKSPIGEISESWARPNGIKIDKVVVPFGLIAVIFEARPNVTVDIAGLCFKTSNGCVLKGGKEAINTNKKLTEIIKFSIKNFADENIITLIEDCSRETTDKLLTKKEFIDLLIPRGGKGLIDYVTSNSHVPFIETGAGVCHIYVDKFADISMAINIAKNAKIQRPAVCNSVENILVHSDVADIFLKELKSEFDASNVEIRGDEKSMQIIDINSATEDDFFTEYNDLIVSVKVVNSLTDTINFINSHSSKHSETIVTENAENAAIFLRLIDSACVYHNASTRFSDGGEFGFGAEVGISTQKLHARGPMGLREICTYKYKIYGNGQVR